MKAVAALAAQILAALLPFSSVAQNYDLIIRHGRVIDGTGNPAFFGDLAIKGGRIVRIGKIEGIATTEIDAKGLVVAPGFIDVHTHADDIAETPKAENFARMGVTTVVLGNCGGSAFRTSPNFSGTSKPQMWRSMPRHWSAITRCDERRWGEPSIGHQRQRRWKK